MKFAASIERMINKRALSLLLTLCLMLSLLTGLGPAAWADSEPLPGIIKYNGEYIAHPRTVRDLFDADYYLERYPELKDLLGLSGDVNRLPAGERELLLTHFMEKGLKEEKTCSPYLNLVRYRAAHPELEKEFGDNWDKYVEYYFTRGWLKGDDSFVFEEDLLIQEELLEEFGDEIEDLMEDEEDEEDEEIEKPWETGKPGKTKKSEDHGHHGDYIEPEKGEESKEAEQPEEAEEPEEITLPINRQAKSSNVGYQLYANPFGTGVQRFENYYFSGWFYPDIYQSILNDPRRGDGTPEYTVMIYLCGTDLEDRSGMASIDLINALAAGYDLSRVNVLVLAGGTMNWHNDVMKENNDSVNLCLYYLDPAGIGRGTGEAFDTNGDYKKVWSLKNVDNILTGDTADETGSLRLLAAYDQVCMGDSELLLGFLDAAYDLFPADHYWLSLWNHGGGSAGGICYGDAVTAEKNASAYRGVEISRDPLTLAKIEEALNSSKIVKERGDLDILSMDACLMAGIEEAYNFSPYVRFLIASEEMTSGEVPYDMFLGQFRSDSPDLSAGEIAVNAASSFISTKPGKRKTPATMSVYDLTSLDECARRMNALGDAMSALMENDDTRAQAVSCLEKSASRVFNFGHLNDTGSDYVDLYDLFSRLKAYLTYEKSFADANGNTEASSLYQAASQAITELLQVSFVAYRGGTFANSEIQEEDVTYAENLLSMDMTGTRLSGLWGALGYDYLCGVTVYFPLRNNLSERYNAESIFPAYVEMLNRYTMVTQSDDVKQSYIAAAKKLSENPGGIFQSMKVSPITYADKDNVQKTDLVLFADFDTVNGAEVTGGQDPVTVFSRTVENYNVDVLRQQTAYKLDTDGQYDPNKAEQINMLVGRTDDIYPGEFVTGEVSLNETSGELNDTSGVAIDLFSMPIYAHMVSGFTEAGTDKVERIDWGMRHPKADDFASQAAKIAKDLTGSFTALDGDVYYQNIENPYRHNMLVFDGKGTFRGTVFVIPGKEENDEDSFTWLSVNSADEQPIRMTLNHYMLSDDGKIKCVEDEGMTLNAPMFSLAHGKDQNPIMTKLWLTDPNGTGLGSQDYNRYALEMTDINEQTYAFTTDAAVCNPKDYGENPYPAGLPVTEEINQVKGQNGNEDEEAYGVERLKAVTEDDSDEVDGRNSPADSVPVPGLTSSGDPVPEVTDSSADVSSKAVPAAAETFSETIPAESAPMQTVPAEATPAETVPADAAPVVETVPADAAPVEAAPVEAAPVDAVPMDAAPAEAVPADAAPVVETVPADAAPVEAAPVEAAPVDAVPMDAAPAEAVPAETTPVEAAPVEAAPAEAAPVEVAPAEAAPVEAAPADAAPAEVAPAETASAESAPEAVSDSAPEAENTAEETPEQ